MPRLLKLKPKERRMKKRKKKVMKKKATKKKAVRKPRKKKVKKNSCQKRKNGHLGNQFLIFQLKIDISNTMRISATNSTKLSLIHS